MLDEDEVRDLNGPGGGDVDSERRVRREIANSNERRRMQSINAGFQSLRTLLPHHEGEKLSKAAILQQTAEYIYQLEQEKTRLLSQNSQLKRLYSLSQQGLNQNSNHDQDSTTSPRLKKKKIALESTTTTTELLKEDEYPQGSSTSTTPSVAELSMQLLNEQRLRMRLEERLKTLEQNSATTPILPTQPLKMEVVQSASVVNAVANAMVSTQQQPSTIESARIPTAVAPVAVTVPPVVPTPATILLAEKNIRVEVEAVTQPKETSAPKEELKVTATPAHVSVPAAVNVLQAATALPVNVTPVSTQPPPSTRSFIITTASPAASNAAAAAPGRQNLDSIVEAIRHLEGDHLFSEDSHKVVKEEVVEFHTTGPLAPQPPTAASLSHHVTVTKNLVPSKINPIPATLLPKQPHPAVLQPHPQPQHKEKSNSIIIVKQCQT
eukprot:04443.XXX_68796_70947_1 [CDS] Oithona nana genome sequencing.